MRRKIIVTGPILSQSGYGEQSRFALRCLRAYEEKFDIYLIATNWGVTSWLHEDTEERRWIDQLLAKTVGYQQQGGQFDLSLQITIPNEWVQLAPVNVGYTAGIESDAIAPVWIEKALMMDRIIVISNHAKYGFENTSFQATNNVTGEIIEDFRCTTPIETVNYAVRNFDLEYKPLDLDLKHKFYFLAMAQMSPRKNIENTIRWFVEEFKNEPVGLLVKLNKGNNSIIDRNVCTQLLQQLLEPYKDRACSVYLLHGDMSAEEITALYNEPKVKAVVSIAHGEGFGLPIYEAACNGVPVLAPDWGGQLDFLYAPTKNKKGKVKNKALFARVDYDIAPIQQEAVWEGVLQAESKWCYPKEVSYRKKMRDIYLNHGRYVSQAKKLRTYILEEFSREKIYKKFADYTYGADTSEVEDLEGWLSDLTEQVHD